jgi:hypothetical protein
MEDQRWNADRAQHARDINLAVHLHEGDCGGNANRTDSDDGADSPPGVV